MRSCAKISHINHFNCKLYIYWRHNKRFIDIDRSYCYEYCTSAQYKAFQLSSDSATSSLGPVSRKIQKLFGPAELSLINLYLKTERCIHLKLVVWREPLFILRICEKNSSVIIKFEILLRLSGCENISGPSRNGPKARPSFEMRGVRLFFFSLKLRLQCLFFGDEATWGDWVLQTIIAFRFSRFSYSTGVPMQTRTLTVVRIYLLLNEKHCEVYPTCGRMGLVSTQIVRELK